MKWREKRDQEDKRPPSQQVVEDGSDSSESDSEHGGAEQGELKYDQAHDNSDPDNSDGETVDSEASDVLIPAQDEFEASSTNNPAGQPDLHIPDSLRVNFREPTRPIGAARQGRRGAQLLHSSMLLRIESANEFLL